MLTDEQLQRATDLKMLVEGNGSGYDIALYADLLIQELGGTRGVWTMDVKHVAPYVMALVVLQMGTKD